MPICVGCGLAVEDGVLVVDIDETTGGGNNTLTCNDGLGLYVAPAQTCRIYNSVDISIPDAVETTVTFDSERYDTDNMHTGSDSRITFNTAGVYVVTLHIVFSTTNEMENIYLSIRMNGTTSIALQALSGNGGAIFISPYISLTTQYKFAAGDYVEARVFQNNGSGSPKDIQSGGNSPEFAATRIATG